MPELKQNILNFGYGVNFKYEGMLSHSFDRFYIVTKFELPRTQDLRLATFTFDFECSYANHTMDNTDYARLRSYCMKIAPYARLYQRQIQYYNRTAYATLANDIGKILPKFPTDRRHRRGIFTTILGMVAPKIIGLAYEGISSFLHHKRHKALHKAVSVMNKRSNIQRNRINHLEDTMIMYGVYNSDTLTDLIDTVHRMQNFTSWNEKTFAGKFHDWREAYVKEDGIRHYAINAVLFLTTVREKYVKMYERFIEELKLYSRAIRVLSQGYLPITLLPPSKLEKILEGVKLAITKSNKDYDLVLTRLYLYYDMKLVTFGIDDQRNLIVQFPVFVQPYTQKGLIMYQIETVPVPIQDKNEQAHSYTELIIDKPYIALNEETYITLRPQELKMCKRIGYEYYCEELFVIKSKTRYSCASAIYFNLKPEIIKTNCEFRYYYNKTNIKPTVLDGGFQIILANWPSYRKIMCSHNNNIPINIPGHPYVLMNRSILCNCDVEAESNFLLESLAACEGPKPNTDLEMHFTTNLAFLNYFDDVIEELGVPISRNWTTQEQTLPLSLETFEISPKLLKAPKTLRNLAMQYKHRKDILNKEEGETENPEEKSKFKSFLNSFLADVLLFIAALITVVITLVIIYVMYGQSKLKALVTNIAMQRIKAVEAADMSDILCTCKTQWYIMGMLLIITLGMLYLVTNKVRKSKFCKGRLFSNNTKILLFVSNTHTYVPIRLCRTAGSIHLFKIKGRLNPEKVKLKKNWIWDVLEIDWSDVTITLNDNEIGLPSSVIIPFRERYRARTLLRKHPLVFYVMLKQGKTWFGLNPEPRDPCITNN